MLRWAATFSGLAVLSAILLFTPMVGSPSIHVSRGATFGSGTTIQIMALLGALGAGLISMVLLTVWGLRKLYRNSSAR
jgi:hypothetical protein